MPSKRQAIEYALGFIALLFIGAIAFVITRLIFPVSP